MATRRQQWMTTRVPSVSSIARFIAPRWCRNNWKSSAIRSKWTRPWITRDPWAFICPILAFTFAQLDSRYARLDWAWIFTIDIANSSTNAWFKSSHVLCCIHSRMISWGAFKNNWISISGHDMLGHVDCPWCPCCYGFFGGHASWGTGNKYITRNNMTSDMIT